MLEQIQWLWAASIGMFYTPTTLWGRRTSVFARRLIVHAAVLGIAVVFAGCGMGLPLSVVAMFVVSLPMAALMNLVVYTVAFQFPLRAFGVTASVIPVFGVIGHLMVWVADLLWRLEAGPQAAGQRSASIRGLARAQTDAWRSELHDAVLTGEAEVLLPSVRIQNGLDSVSFGDLELRGGILFGRADGPEVAFATVAFEGDRFVVRANEDRRVLFELDGRGRDQDGNLQVTHPTLDKHRWEEVADVHVPGRPTAWVAGARKKAVVHSLAAGALAMASLFVPATIASMVESLTGASNEAESAQAASAAVEQRGRPTAAAPKEDPASAFAARFARGLTDACRTPDAYMALYAPTFRAGYAHDPKRRALDHAGWRARRLEVCAKYPGQVIEVQTSNARMEGGAVSFCQHYTSRRADGSRYEDWTIKNLAVEGQGRELLIRSEDEVPANPGCRPRPSFDCGQAENNAQRLICADPVLAWADYWEADTFVVKRRTLKGAARVALEEEQTRWQEQRDRECTAAADPAACLLTRTDARRVALGGAD